MTQIENRLFEFFIENLSYCAYNKQNGIPLYAKLTNYNGKVADNDYLDEVIDWTENIIKRCNFYNNKQLPKPIFLFFPDEEIVKGFDLVFDKLNFELFLEYYLFCKNHFLDNYDNQKNQLELFSCINLFHLIGSFRYFLENDENRAKIKNELYEIIKEQYHPLIKYSALQITSLVEIEGNNNPTSYQDSSFEEVFIDQIELLTEQPMLSKYISFYSMFYYNNRFSPEELIEEKYFKKIIPNLNQEVKNELQVDFRYLHTLIPQIATQLIRLDKDKYKEYHFENDLLDLFKTTKDEDATEKIIKLRKKINNRYV